MRYWHTLAILLFLTSIAIAHGGGTDSSGGHNGPGGYHYHGSGSHRSRSWPSTSTTSYRTEARSSARDQARTGAKRRADDRRLERAERARQRAIDKKQAEKRKVEEEIERQRALEAAIQDRIREILEDEQQLARAQTRLLDRSRKSRFDVRFVFHHSIYDPIDVSAFVGDGDRWRVFQSNDKVFMRYLKRRIVRMEPVHCPTEYRTWVDTTGSFSSVARFVDYSRPTVTLETYDHRQVHLKFSRLCEHDREVVEELSEGREGFVGTSWFFRSRFIDQAAQVHDVCISNDTGKWLVSAEAEVTTKHNKRLPDEQWEHPKQLTLWLEDGANPSSRDDAVIAVLSQYYPEEDWSEIEESEFLSLRNDWE